MLRVFKEGYVNAVLAQWRFDYISNGYCPIQFGDFNVPNDILEKLFMDAFPEHFSNKVSNTTKSVSNKPITNTTITATDSIIKTTDVITKNDIVMSAIRNSGGNKDILFKCLELSKDYNVINEVINNCNSDPYVILHCLSLIESNDSCDSLTKEDSVVIPIADEIELDVAATIEDTTDVDVTPTADTDITNTADDVVSTITDVTTPVADDVPVVSTDPPTPRRRGKVRYNV